MLLPNQLFENFANDQGEHLIGQYIITRNYEYIPTAWDSYQIDGYYIAHHPALRLLKAECDNEYNTVIFLGYLIDIHQKTFNIAPRFAVNDDIFLRVESCLNDLSGRFICFVSNGSNARVYLDASGSLSAVYARESEIIASSIMLIPYVNGIDDDIDLIKHLDIPNQNRIFPLELTPRLGCSRLLPNHYLDMKAWEPTRHWPTAPFQETDLSDAGDTISNGLAATIETVIENHAPAYMSVTAGYDSRTLLACSKKYSRDIEYFTWELPDQTAYNDCVIAKKISEDLSLPCYKSIPFKESSQRDKELWLYRTGLTAGEKRGLSLTTTVREMGHEKFYLAGFAGESLRGGMYMRENDTDATTVSVDDLLKRSRLSSHPRIKFAMSKWVENQPSKNIFDIISILYVELQLGCWAGITSYGHAVGPKRLHPFSNRNYFNLIFGIPFNKRHGKELHEYIIEKNWPELLSYAYNPKEPDTLRRNRFPIIQRFWDYIRN